MDAPKSGAPRKVSYLQQTAQYVATAVASLTIAHAEPTEDRGMETKRAQATVQSEPLAEYTIKVAKMTEAELRVESDTLAAKIQPLIDADASDAEVDPLLSKYDIVAHRLDPIIQKSTEEMKQASKLIKEIQAQLETPEKIDPDTLLANLQKALRIHKKYNPELYVSND